MRKSTYHQRPIAGITSLARALSCSPSRLEYLRSNADSYYFPAQPISKSDGTYRQPYGVRTRLKKVQHAIKTTILDRVKHPTYLQGSIRDRESPRSYLVDAALHTDCAIIIGLDISKFFPSTKDDRVFDIWKYFFHFPPDVAEMLTALTTFQGSLPEGAQTSPGLANLVFYDSEPELEEVLRQHGLRYSRYVDDVTVSTDRYLSSGDLRHVFTQVFGMFRSKGLSPKRSKISVVTKGNPLQVHQLNINSGHPTLPQKERSRIRAAVKECELLAREDSHSSEYAHLWLSTQGRVRMMHAMHPRVSGGYLQRLDAISPFT